MLSTNTEGDLRVLQRAEIEIYLVIQGVKVTDVVRTRYSEDRKTRKRYRM